jgi:hypothetical protein
MFCNGKQNKRCSYWTSLGGTSPFQNVFFLLNMALLPVIDNMQEWPKHLSLKEVRVICISVFSVMNRAKTRPEVTKPGPGKLQSFFSLFHRIINTQVWKTRCQMTMKNILVSSEIVFQQIRMELKWRRAIETKCGRG